jgi:hypothetical protein
MQEPRRDGLAIPRPRLTRNGVVFVGRRVLRTERVTRPRLIKIVGIVDREGARIKRLLIVERVGRLFLPASAMAWP